MAIAELFPVMHYLHKLAAERHPEGVTDADLLAQFSARRDDAAFTALVQRHGRMVWNVCRRLVRDWQATEDAFQATFMVLARKAAAIRAPERLSCWLYGVAYRTALKARTARARRRREQPLADQPAKTAPDWENVRPVLDEEIGRLPGPCRTAFILCYLEGKTNDQAARLLGWPKGTVATRLARARERLRLRLVRHGVTLSAAALSAMLAPDSLAAALPPGLVAPTAKTALRFAAGQAAVMGLSSRAATLAQGVINTMFATKLKLMAALALTVAVLVSGTGTLLLSGAPSAADASGETAAADKTEPQYEAVMTAPAPSPAEQALFFSASTNFLLGHYREARRECARFVQSYADSALAHSAIQLGLIATQLADRGEHDASQTAKAEAIINAALKGQPLAAQIKQPVVAGQLADAELAQADKDFRVAEFYRRTNHPGSAFFYYEIVRRRYPGTEYAEKASKQLETLCQTARQEKQPRTTADAPEPPPPPREDESSSRPLRETWEERIYAALREDRCWAPAGVKCALWVRQLDGRRLMDVTFKRRDGAGKYEYDLIAHAKEAEIRVDAKNNTVKIYLQRGEYQEPSSGTRGYFEQRVFQVQLPSEAILGPPSSTPEQIIFGLSIQGHVHSDRNENKAWVSGAGAIRIPTSVGIYGERLAKPATLTIHWDRDMFFDGSRAVFHGGVRAEQGNTRLACQELQVFLDRTLPLDPNPLDPKSSTAPVVSIESIVCDKSVRLEVAERTNGKQSRYQRIESAALSYNSAEGVTIAPGPGTLRVLQSEGAARSVYEMQTGSLRFFGGLANVPGRGLTVNTDAGRSGSIVLNEGNVGIGTLTRVNYRGRMFANNTKRTLIFYEGVEVVQMPSNDPDLAIDPDKLPEKALYLRGDQLKFYTRQQPNAKPNEENRQLEAHGHALVKAPEFSGRADVVKYDESTDLLVLEASEGNLATLSRQRAKGAAQEEVKGKKIYYWRRTNDFKIASGAGSQGTEAPSPGGSSKANAMKQWFETAQSARQSAAEAERHINEATTPAERAHYRSKCKLCLEKAADAFQKVLENAATEVVASPDAAKVVMVPRRPPEEEAMARQAAFAVAECRFELGQYNEALRQYNALANGPREVDTLIALRGVWQCYSVKLETEQAKRTLDRIGTALREMPDAGFDNCREINTRRWWEEWLREKRNP
jgi:RNA polymerase sigma factor (sigma-70 family)